MPLLTLIDGFLLLVLLCVVFMLALRFLAPYFIKLIFKRLSKKMEKELGREYEFFKGKKENRPFRPNTTEPKKSEKSFGEYVDFEEID